MPENTSPIVAAILAAANIQKQTRIVTPIDMVKLYRECLAALEVPAPAAAPIDLSQDDEARRLGDSAAE